MHQQCGLCHLNDGRKNLLRRLSVFVGVVAILLAACMRVRDAAALSCDATHMTHVVRRLAAISRSASVDH